MMLNLQHRQSQAPVESVFHICEENVGMALAFGYLQGAIPGESWPAERAEPSIASVKAVILNSLCV
jgi:hypothetical protein